MLTPRELNRALLARQLLLERATVAVPRALELMGCLQAQYAPSMYIGLWSRVEGLRRDDLTRLLEERAIGVGLWLDLVRVPPSGTWERRRADLYGSAEDWLGPSPPGLTKEAATAHLVRRYLTGFGPGTAADTADWGGLRTADVQAVLDGMRLHRFTTEEGLQLYDLPGAPLPDAGTPAPVRFLPTWDASLLVHARRKGILAEEHRPLIFNTKTPHSVPTFVVDGRVAGTWRYEKGEVRVQPFEPLPKRVQAEVDEEASRLAAFHT